MIYLDNAATTLHKPASVARAMTWALKNLASPGRGGHAASMAAAEEAYACRCAAARLFNMRQPENVVITSSATHALNIAIKTLARRGDRVLISGYEHNSVTRPLHEIGARVVVCASELFEPEMALHAFERRLTDDTKLVVCNHVSNVFGYILPIERIAEACRARGVPFIVDASQSAGVCEIDFERIGADFICMPGHKSLYGPQGTGLLLCARLPKSLMQGGTGSQSALAQMPDTLPDRAEAGTHNMPGIAGLRAGLEFVEKKNPKKIFAHEHSLMEYAAGELTRLDRVRVFVSEYGFCQSGVLSFTVEKMDCETVGEELAKRNIAVRAGLHCAPLAHKTAGTFETGTVRVSFSVFNTKGHVRALVDALEEIIRKR